jgi:hypothetical protein
VNTSSLQNINKIHRKSIGNNFFHPQNVGHEKEQKSSTPDNKNNEKVIKPIRQSSKDDSGVESFLSRTASINNDEDAFFIGVNEFNSLSQNVTIDNLYGSFGKLGSDTQPSFCSESKKENKANIDSDVLHHMDSANSTFLEGADYDDALEASNPFMLAESTRTKSEDEVMKYKSKQQRQIRKQTL